MNEDEYQEPEYYEQEEYQEFPDYGEDFPRSTSQEEPMVVEEPGDVYEEEADYIILPLEKLFKELANIIEDIKKLVYLDEGWCLLLLKDFKWDKEYLKEEFYNNSEMYLEKIGLNRDLAHPTLFRRNFTGTCEVCMAEDTELLFNICNDKFCLDCWINHLSSRIQSSSPFVKCLGECGCPVLQETILGIFGLHPKGNIWIKRYQKKLCELFSTTNKNYKFCTGVDCGNCIKLNNQELLTVECNCGKMFCFRCQNDDHNPCSCEEKTKWADQVMKEEADAKWIAQNAKLCPWCKKAVERSVGCNFMACICGKNFCYMCSKPWEPDHKDHFKCHIFKKKPDQVENRQKQVMEKMNHCTERYLFNQAVANNYRTIDIFAKRKYIFRVLKIQLTDSEFLDSAYKFAIECCQKLKWIYAYTYFTEIKDRSHKERFDFALGEYEKYKENLLKMLAVDLKQFMGNVEKAQEISAIDHQMICIYTEEFKMLKKTIVNYYTCTKNYKEKFVEELNRMSIELRMKKQAEEDKELFIIPSSTEKKNSSTKMQEEVKKLKKGKSSK